MGQTGRSKRRPARALGKHRGRGADRLTISRRLANETEPCVPGLFFIKRTFTVGGSVNNRGAVTVRGGTERGRRPRQVEVVSELQLQAARMAASCVRSCRSIHVVTKHEAGYRSGLLVVDMLWCYCGYQVRCGRLICYYSCFILMFNFWSWRTVKTEFSDHWGCLHLLQEVPLLQIVIVFLHNQIICFLTAGKVWLKDYILINWSSETKLRLYHDQLKMCFIHQSDTSLIYKRINNSRHCWYPERYFDVICCWMIFCWFT